MKRKTPKEILAESFRELAQTRNIDKITIKEIACNCGYAPATFYRYFKDKYDLIAWDYAEGTARIMGRINDTDYEWRRTLLDGALRFQTEKDYLANLIRHTTGHDSFVRYMTEINYALLEKHILALSGKEALDETEALYVRIYCLGTVSLTCEWILGKYDVSAERIAEIYENSLPRPLERYLGGKMRDFSPFLS